MNRAATRRRLDPSILRAAWWALRVRPLVAWRLHRRGLDAALWPPAPPPLPEHAVRGARMVLRRLGATCLVRSIVLQRWEADHGRRRDLIIAVTAPSAGFRAHAWLDGDVAHGDYTELTRRSAAVPDLPGPR